MSLIIATAVDCTVPRGTFKVIRFQIDDDLGDPYNLTNHIVKLFLSHNRNEEDFFLEKEGNIFNAEAGTVEFDFIPGDTADLMSRSYDADIIVHDETTEEEWPAFHGSIAVTPSAGGVSIE